MADQMHQPTVSAAQNTGARNFQNGIGVGPSGKSPHSLGAHLQRGALHLPPLALGSAVGMTSTMITVSSVTARAIGGSNLFSLTLPPVDKALRSVVPMPKFSAARSAFKMAAKLIPGL